MRNIIERWILSKEELVTIQNAKSQFLKEEQPTLQPGLMMVEAGVLYEHYQHDIKERNRYNSDNYVTYVGFLSR